MVKSKVQKNFICEICGAEHVSREAAETCEAQNIGKIYIKTISGHHVYTWNTGDYIFQMIPLGIFKIVGNEREGHIQIPITKDQWGNEGPSVNPYNVEQFRLITSGQAIDLGILIKNYFPGWFEEPKEE